MTSVSPWVANGARGRSSSRAQLAVVVDLAVEHDDDRAVLVVDRLVARLEVDHAQALDARARRRRRGGCRASPGRGARAPRTSARAARGRPPARRGRTCPAMPHMSDERAAARFLTRVRTAQHGGRVGPGDEAARAPAAVGGDRPRRRRRRRRARVVVEPLSLVVDRARLGERRLAHRGEVEHVQPPRPRPSRRASCRRSACRRATATGTRRSRAARARCGRGPSPRSGRSCRRSPAWRRSGRCRGRT